MRDHASHLTSEKSPMIRSFSVFLIVAALTVSSGFVRAQDYWQKTETSPGGSGADGVVTTLVVNAKGHIFGCTNAGVSRSTDDGKSWTLLKNPTGITLGPIFGLNTKGDIFAGVGYINY